MWVIKTKIMSEKKQTSVDVLFEILWECPRDKFEWNAVLKEVKEMHQKEIEEAYVDGQTISNAYSGASDYYNETFE